VEFPKLIALARSVGVICGPAGRGWIESRASLTRRPLAGPFGGQTSFENIWAASPNAWSWGDRAIHLLQFPTVGGGVTV
jgi:hypothetical protein